jgi:hypothetical protein
VDAESRRSSFSISRSDRVSSFDGFAVCAISARRSRIFRRTSSISLWLPASSSRIFARPATLPDSRFSLAISDRVLFIDAESFAEPFDMFLMGPESLSIPLKIT